MEIKGAQISMRKLFFDKVMELLLLHASDVIIPDACYCLISI